MIPVLFPCFRACCQLQTNFATPSRNSEFRDRFAGVFQRNPRLARGSSREPCEDTKKAVVCCSFAEFSAVLGEPRDDREGTELSHALHVSAGCSRSLVDRARSAQTQLWSCCEISIHYHVLFCCAFEALWYTIIPAVILCYYT